jgi:ATP-binding cassette subfamily B protein
MELPERGGIDADLRMNENISLNNVSFTYPSAEQKAVDNVTFTVKPGETVAVVGENGSGKTTLVRLITGLYLPDSGDILYGCTSTKTISARSLFKNISAVFQKFQRYQMTLRENIGISDTAKQADDTELDKICAQAGIEKDGSSLPNGYDTMLSREFDGVDLSGGQWQRAAIARSFFRPHQFIVLDEPTAAIDPIEETKIYNRFAEISKGKTAVIVTHRLGSVKLADRILVMKQGRLIEQGTHTELMDINGEYFRLYKSQEQWYKK